MLTAVTGINWGDEGKGRVIDLLAENADIVALSSPLIRTKRKTQHIVLSFSSAVKQSKSEPFPSDATSVASPKVTVCVPSL